MDRGWSVPSGMPGPHRRGARHLEYQIAQMLGLARRVHEDGVVTEQEAALLRTWIRARPEVSRTWPGTVLSNRLERIFEDGVVDDVERRELARLLEDTVKGELGVFTPDEAAASLPVSTPAPEIVFVDRIFVLTGTFAWGARWRCDEAVLRRGGVVNARVSPDTEYLVVGTFRRSEASGSGLSSPVVQAIRYRRLGAAITILTERQWLKALEERSEYRGWQERSH